MTDSQPSPVLLALPALPDNRTLGGLYAQFREAGMGVWGTLAISTAASYSSGLNTFIQALGPTLPIRRLVPAHMKSVFITASEGLSPVRVSQIRGGWRCFRDWAGSELELFLPDVPARQWTKAPWVPTTPDAVGDAVVALLDYFGKYKPTQRAFLALRWPDLRDEGDGVLLIPRGKQGHFLPCPPAMLTLLRAHAQGDAAEPPHGPLLPSERGGAAPMSLSTFRRLLASARDREDPGTQPVVLDLTDKDDDEAGSDD